MIEYEYRVMVWLPGSAQWYPVGDVVRSAELAGIAQDDMLARGLTAKVQQREIMSWEDAR